jgi:hypothetical protein
MKTSQVLALVLISLTVTGCVSREIPLQQGADRSRPAQDVAADEQSAVAQLLEAHHETVGQMRVTAVALRPQQQVDCN